MQRSRPWMRAMPSPTVSTVPTSETSTPAVKPAELLADDLRDLFGANLHALSWSPGQAPRRPARLPRAAAQPARRTLPS